MTPEAEDFLQQAGRALEAACRDLDAEDADNAIARSYYAMFYAASAALSEIGENAKTHQGTHHLFFRHFVKTGPIGREHTRNLSAVHADRQDADYGRGFTFSVEDAMDDVQMAQAFVDAVEEHLQERPS